MASQVKVQGKTIGDCLECLRIYSEKYGVTYNTTFGFNSKQFVVKPFTTKSTESIYLSFMWRHEYREYDNSL